MDVKNYTVGKGVFAFKPTGLGYFHDLGNATSGTISFAVELLDHYSTRSKYKTLDSSTVKSIDATLNITVDDINVVNLKNFLLGEEAATGQTSGTWGSGTELSVTATVLDVWYELGKVAVSNIVVQDETDMDTYEFGTDYELDETLGMIRFLSTGSITAADVLHITGDYGDDTDIMQILAGLLTNISGEVAFMSDPTSGRKTSFKGQVQMSPTGDLGLISDDYATLQFQCKFTKGSADELFKMFTSRTS